MAMIFFADKGVSSGNFSHGKNPFSTGQQRRIKERKPQKKTKNNVSPLGGYDKFEEPAKTLYQRTQKSLITVLLWELNFSREIVWLNDR